MRTPLVAAVVLAVALAGCVDSGRDPDGDGLPNSIEEQFGTDPDNPDTDGDGLTDKEEVTDYSNLGVDPLKADTDGDGLNDHDEILLYGTDPARADSDRDGLNDGEEVERFGDWSCTDQAGNTTCVRQEGPDPLKADTDGDRWPDGEEVGAWMDRLDDPRTAGILATQADVDGDGWEDGVDADPFADLKLRINVPRIDLHSDVGSEGANLTVVLRIAAASRQVHVGQIPTGTTQLNVNWTRDIDDGPAKPGDLQASALLSAYHGADNGSRTALRIQADQTSVTVRDYNLGDWQLAQSNLRETTGQDADLAYRLVTCRPDC